MRLLALIGVLTLMFVGGALAQAQMSVREFNEIAANAPRDPSALLRPSVRRAANAIQGAFEAARAEEAAARRAGRTPPYCMPERIRLSPDDIVARMKAVPTARQNQTLNQAVRAWMVERYPCR
jgi:hypothetical protein